MPKIPIVSGMDVIRVLKTLGFIVIRQRGSHVILRKENFGCVVPNLQELKIGTLKGLLKQANVSLELFITTLYN